MGMLTDLFVATKADARKYEERLVKDEIDIDAIYPRASHKGITGIELSILWASLLREQVSAKHLFKPVSSATDDGLTEALPQQFVKMLAELPESKTGEAAEVWSEHPEISLNPTDLTPVLLDLTSLARKAIEVKKDLFIWYCP
jgi:hypothetical protein